MQFYVARRASLGDHAVTICFVAIGILRPMLDQHLVRMVFAPLACRNRQIRVAVGDRFSPVGLTTQPGVELGNRVRSGVTDAALGQQDADGHNADNDHQFPCHDSTTFNRR